MSHLLLSSEGYNILANERTFSDHPQSELNFGDSAASNKHTFMALSQHNDLQLENKLCGSAGATTSWHLPAVELSPLSGDIVSSLYNQNLEIEAVVQYKNEQLQSGIESLRRKHARDLALIMEQQATKRLRVEEMKLEYVCRRNRELEEKVKLLSYETLVWFNYSKTTEAVVSSLRSTLHQVTNQSSCFTLDVEESYGESFVVPSRADGPETFCQEDESCWNCRVCRECEVCVLLLPCRHLCICRDCEACIDTCPVCNATKNASIQVVVS